MWELLAETPSGLRAFAVFVAPSRDRWRARVAAFPDADWKDWPGGAAPWFSDRSSQAALEQAVRFVEDHCRERGYRLTYPMTTPRSARPTVRKLRSLPVRYGPTRPDAGPSGVATTLNLSVEGLFVATPSPPDPGAVLHLELELEGEPATLDGLVVWTRERPQPGRPPGMGIRLLAPPVRYGRYVRGLA
jgi:hypothetical protein